MEEALQDGLQNNVIWWLLQIWQLWW